VDDLRCKASGKGIDRHDMNEGDNTDADRAAFRGLDGSGLEGSQIVFWLLHDISA